MRENKKGNFTTLTSQSSKCYSALLTTCILVNYLQGKKIQQCLELVFLSQSSQLCHVIQHHLKLSFNRATELVVGHRLKCRCPQIFLSLQQGKVAKRKLKISHQFITQPNVKNGLGPLFCSQIKLLDNMPALF